MKRFKILPLLILTAFLAFSVRLADVVIGVSQLGGTAQAQEEVHAEPPAMPGEEDHAAENPVEEIAVPEDAAAEPMPKKSPGLIFADEEEKQDEEDKFVIKDETPLQDWRDAGDSDLDYTAVRMELYEDLAERRKEIEKREKEAMAREALLKAAEKELDRKYQEMQQLRGELEGLLSQQSEEEQNRIGSLVKIYEGMKPKDAARIFDTLDLDVLTSVMGKMSERKLSPILAAMNAERARTITIILAEQKQLPELPQSN